MESIISAVLAPLAQTAPYLTGSTAIGSAIKFISTVLVPGIQLAKDEIPIVQGIIKTLTGNKSTTVVQMGELDLLNARCDAILDAAISDAEAADRAIGAS